MCLVLNDLASGDDNIRLSFELFSKKQCLNLEDMGPVSLTLVLGKAMEQVILGEITGHAQDNWGNRPSQYGFLLDQPDLLLFSSDPTGG